MKKKQNKDMETPSNKTDPPSYWVGLAMSWSFLGMFLVFYGVIWLWSSLKQDDSVMNMYRVSHDFQAKIDNPHALKLLTNCLQKALPDRNATIADFSTCLKAMGMRDS